MATQPHEETLGQRVKRLREAKTALDPLGKPTEMTQEILARECQCSKDTISRIECDRQLPSWELGIALAKALGTTMGYLAGLEK